VSGNEKYLEPAGLRVTVDKVIYHPGADAPVDPALLLRFISSPSITTLTSPSPSKPANGVVTNANGEVMALEGEGVVGQTPTIESGEAFDYNSFHLLDTRTATAEGSYIGLDALGHRVLTRIPKFEMQVPLD